MHACWLAMRNASQAWRALALATARYSWCFGIAGVQVGQAVVVGSEWGKVRSLRGTGGKAVSEVLPGQPAEIAGLKGLPQAGDELLVRRCCLAGLLERVYLPFAPCDGILQQIWQGREPCHGKVQLSKCSMHPHPISFASIRLASGRI